MFRQGLFALAVLIMCLTLATAETIKGKITKISENSVSVKVGKDEAKSYPIAKDCQFLRLVKKDKDDKGTEEKIEGGVKSSVLSKLPEKGISATVTTDDKTKQVTKILITGKTPK
jgi:hypothetical protein